MTAIDRTPDLSVYRRPHHDADRTAAVPLSDRQRAALQAVLVPQGIPAP